MNATIDEAPSAPLATMATPARIRVTPGATPQTPLLLLQTPCRPGVLRKPIATPPGYWLARLSTWLRPGR